MAILRVAEAMGGHTQPWQTSESPLDLTRVHFWSGSENGYGQNPWVLLPVDFFVHWSSGNGTPTAKKNQV